MTVDELRMRFPELSVSVYGKPLVYLDNAATAQKPDTVMSKLIDMTVKKNSNLHRAVHFMANAATEEFENARIFVARSIGATDPGNIVFTSGTTQAINLVAFSFGEAFVHEGDEILVSEAEHHSNIVPWKMMCERENAILKYIPVNDDGSLCISSLPQLISEKTRLVCVTHISNVLGIINQIDRIVDICHSKNCPVLLDGAQGIVHSKVDVSKTDCDFYVFSGHKIYASSGTGVLYAKKKWLDEMPPYMGGGEMISEVKWSGITYSEPPHKFEAGTQNISGVPTLLPALELLQEMSCPEITSNSESVKEYVYHSLNARSDVHLFGTVENISEKAPVFSFRVEGVHHEDLALVLDKMSIAVRSGQMCAEPLMDRFGVSGMVRASFAPYNTMQEAEYFIKSLDRAVKMLR